MSHAEKLKTQDVHYWMPIPQPDGRRHAFPGARRWDGRSTGTAVCGTTVPMATPSETDWILCPTCPRCWADLVSKHCPGFDPEGENPEEASQKS